jgi:hypothetical protein
VLGGTEPGQPGPHPAAHPGRAAFVQRFRCPQGLSDVVDGDMAEAGRLRPNQLLAVSLPFGPFRGRAEAAAVVAAARSHLLTPLGLRSLSPPTPPTGRTTGAAPRTGTEPTIRARYGRG